MLFFKKSFMVKLIWVLIGMDTLAFLIFLSMSAYYSSGRQVDGIERSFTVAVAGIGVIIILLSAIPLYFFHSKGVVIFSGIIAALPLTFLAWYFISNKLTEIKQNRSYAETYYSDKSQRKIAAAIEQGDTVLLKQLIKGQNLDIKGTKVYDSDGLNYLQFAIRRRGDPSGFPYNEADNDAAIRILIENGSPVNPYMDEAIRCVSPKMLSLLLDAGANPNDHGVYSTMPPLFDAISNNDSAQNEIAILLIQKGADVNAKNNDGFTPVMFAAYNSGTSEFRLSTWPLVRYLLQDAHADIKHTNENGINLNSIIQDIKTEAKEKNIAMPEDFDWVVKWLQEHHAN